MPWFAIVHNATGRLFGVVSTSPEQVPPGHVLQEFATRPDQGTVWNPSTRTFAPRPADPVVDRLQDALNHPALSGMWQRLQPAQRTALRKYLLWLLGSRRFRNPNEEVAVDPPDGWPTDPTQVVE